ncbi:MAG: acetylxylan esterase [Alistipes sp.]|nr:acetylxylan esterase [Alistipes sp.]
MRRLLYIMILAACCSGTAGARGLVESKVACTQDWIYQSEVFFNIMLTAGEQPATGVVELRVETDKGSAVCAMSQSYSIAAGSPEAVQFRLSGLPAGFYRATLLDDGEKSEAWNFGVRPDEVLSPRDAQADFWPFWQRTLDELAAVAPEYRLERDRARSGRLRDVYTVEMRSWGGETIRGYWVVPKGRGQWPAIVCYMGYGAEPYCPEADARGDVAEFVLSHRGQGLNKPTNSYGDWIRHNLGQRDAYYYRGAFMDAVRAIDFVASRPQTDPRNIFVEGGSQGGALTLVAASLDSRVAAAAPFVPFLSDFPDYFEIVDWPKAPVMEEAARRGIDRDSLYRMLSYFDVKNFVEHIRCPVLMGFGLQDDVCPPHTNFAGYNNIRTAKRWEVFPRSGHHVEREEGWWRARSEFFDEHTTR